MVYVACSRVKNPTDLTIVGAEYPVNGKPWLHWLCKTDPAVSRPLWSVSFLRRQTWQLFT